MKNIFFLFAFTLISSLSFANSNETSKIKDNVVTSKLVNNISEVGICSYSITRTIYYQDGSVEQETRYYTSYAVNLQDCKNQANTKLTMLQDGAPF